jgi:hypothetical protein
LHAACGDREDAGCDDLDQFRIEVALRLVPEEIFLLEDAVFCLEVEQRARGDGDGE